MLVLAVADEASCVNELLSLAMVMVMNDFYDSNPRTYEPARGGSRAPSAAQRPSHKRTYVQKTLPKLTRHPPPLVLSGFT